MNYLYIVCSLVIIGLHGPPPAIPRLAKQTNIMQIIPLHCEPVMSNQIRNKTKSFCYKDCWSKVSWKISAQAYIPLFSKCKPWDKSKQQRRTSEIKILQTLSFENLGTHKSCDLWNFLRMCLITKNWEMHPCSTDFFHFMKTTEKFSPFKNGPFVGPQLREKFQRMKKHGSFPCG